MTLRIILYAPNVHTGGGYVLLRSLIESWPAGPSIFVILDQRAQERLSLGSNVDVLMWTARSFLGRWKAEALLASFSRAGDLVLCFHGLPPLLNSPARKVVFLQNRLYVLRAPSLSRFRLTTAIRLAVERLMGWFFRARVDEYLVQTPSMARALISWHSRGGRFGISPTVRVLPFVEDRPPAELRGARQPDWDFIYVADGEAHKNHCCLLAAWHELAKQGITPRLALTLGSRDSDLIQKVDTLREQLGVNVYNLGPMSHDAILQLYERSRALIFPSFSESFGLPLVEAQQRGLPILASELDYVRDVCDPVQTFDPSSPYSIARAVRRFIGKQEPPPAFHSPADFWVALLEKCRP